jgi:protein tyrosine/serine phosphatase
LSAPDATRKLLGGEERILEWEGCFNVRDLGRLPAREGARTRWGAVVRSDIPSRLTERGRAALVAHGISTIVDLRADHEVTSDAELYPFREPSPGHPSYRHVPFNVWDDEAPGRVARDRAAQTREEMNPLDLDINARGIASAVAAVADAPPGGVLVHCHAGKDRTGIVVALILTLVGVSDDDIADDYSLTMLNLEPLIAEWIDTIDEADRDRMRALATPRREAMLATLEHLRERYGGAEKYLLGAGASADQIARIRERLVGPNNG